MPPFQVRFKNASVNARGHPELWRGLYELCVAIHEVGDEIPVITSMWDQRHSPVSLHYVGCAADVRSKTLTGSQKRKVLQRVQNRLGDDFDLILEAEGEPGEHFHLEVDVAKFDRKQAVRRAWGIE